MTAIAANPITARDSRQPRAPAGRIPLWRLCEVELRKMFDTRSGFWLMASILIAALVATAAVILFAAQDELAYSTFVLAIGFPMAVILPVIAILSVTSEWSQRTGLTTFTLVPHRSRIIVAKAISSVTVGIVAILLSLAVGALGNLASAAITGTTLVWDVSLADCLYIILGSVLSLLTGFMLGLLIRASAGALAAYFVYAFVLPTAFLVLANSQAWFRDLQPWIDVQYAQGALFTLAASPTGEQWANIAVTGAVWLLIPLAIGLGFVVRAEVK